MTTWVFIRGLIRSLYHWHVFPNFFHQFAPQDRLIFLELPGNGERYQETTPQSIPDIAKALWSQLETSTPQNYHVIGISMGAMVAVEMAKQHPKLISQLHLINTSFGRFSPSWKRMKPKALCGLLPNAFSIPSREKAILKWTTNRPVSNELQELWIDQQKKNPTSYSNTLRQITAAGSYQGPDQGPIENIYFYASRKDRLVDISCSKKAAVQWRKTISYHNTAGHDLPMDDPKWLAQEIIHHSQLPNDIQSH